MKNSLESKIAAEDWPLPPHSAQPLLVKTCVEWQMITSYTSVQVYTSVYRSFFSHLCVYTSVYCCSR